MKYTLSKEMYLREVELFQDLTSQEIEALGERMPIKVVAAGTVFYSPGDATEILFLIKEGRVRLYHLSATGKSFSTAVLEAGTFFGEMTILGQALYDNYAEAVTPCMLCLMSRSDVKTLLLGDPRISFRIVEMLGRRLIEVERRLADIALKPVFARLATLLVQLANKRADDELRANLRSGRSAIQPIEVSYTHEELAQMVGVHRETITRVLNELRTEGLIELHRGRISLLDVDKLCELGNQ